MGALAPPFHTSIRHGQSGEAEVVHRESSLVDPDQRDAGPVVVVDLGTDLGLCPRARLNQRVEGGKGRTVELNDVIRAGTGLEIEHKIASVPSLEHEGVV